MGSNDGWQVELGYEVAPFAKGFNEGALVGELIEGIADGSSVGRVDGSSVGLRVGR